MAQTKQEYYTIQINKMLQTQLENLKHITNEIEEIINAEIEMNLKVIRTLECMQKIKFDAWIFRELQEMEKTE